MSDLAKLEATAREALEVAEEELAFVKDTGSDKMVVSRRATYKRQRVLARGVLELLEEQERLQEEESTCQAMYADATEHMTRLAAENERLRSSLLKVAEIAGDGRLEPWMRMQQMKAEAVREALAPREEQQ